MTITIYNMKCKLTASIDAQACQYSGSGIAQVKLLNWYPMEEGTTAKDDRIVYTVGDKGAITAILPPAGETFYGISFNEGSANYTDELTVGSNGGKYRTHTLNLVNGQLDTDALEQVDALSLGKFVAVVLDNAGRIVVLGRTGGLSATSYNYDSGKDAGSDSGWTGVFSGTARETAQLVESLDAITPKAAAYSAPVPKKEK